MYPPKETSLRERGNAQALALLIQDVHEELIGRDTTEWQIRDYAHAVKEKIHEIKRRYPRPARRTHV